MDGTNNDARWSAVEVEHLRPGVRDYLHGIAFMVPAAAGLVIGLVAGLHGWWPEVPAPVWWVLVGFAISECLTAASRVLDLVRARVAVLRCRSCGEAFSDPYEVAEHQFPCAVDAALAGGER